MAWFKLEGAAKRYEDGTVKDLDSLLDFLKAQNELDRNDDDKLSLDMTELPTFGGEEPASTIGVWSWDEDNVLVGTCVDDFRIMSRAEWADHVKAIPDVTRQ